MHHSIWFLSPTAIIKYVSDICPIPLLYLQEFKDTGTRFTTPFPCLFFIPQECICFHIVDLCQLLSLLHGQYYLCLSLDALLWSYYLLLFNIQTLHTCTRDWDFGVELAGKDSGELSAVISWVETSDTGVVPALVLAMYGSNWISPLGDSSTLDSSKSGVDVIS